MSITSSTQYAPPAYPPPQPTTTPPCTSKSRYAPPAYPPPRAALLPPTSSTPYPIDFELLASQGWLSLPIADSPSDPLHTAYAALFSASAQFFSLPDSECAKHVVAARRSGAQASEEGYQHIPGEKRMLTLRRADTTPVHFGLREKADAAWRASADVMSAVLEAVEETLAMKKGTLMRTAEAQLALPPEGAGCAVSLMRSFRYDRPSAGPDATSRVVADSHKDLGLLTIVVGHSPGLECWDATGARWVSCEETDNSHGDGGLRATLLVGQTLSKFTNWRYTAGRHRVFVNPCTSPSPTPNSPDSTTPTDPNPSPPPDPLSSPSHRFSLVHALRAYLPLRVSHTDFETSITGKYAPPVQFVDASVLEIYRAISEAHWNVNISVAERERQRLMLLKRAESTGTNSSTIASADVGTVFEAVGQGQEQGQDTRQEAIPSAPDVSGTSPPPLDADASENSPNNALDRQSTLSKLKTLFRNKQEPVTA